MSSVDGIDAVLCDRLKELGLDFVAAVIEGSRKPTREQMDVLRFGYVQTRGVEQGVPLVGGCGDGRKLVTDKDRLQVPVPSLMLDLDKLMPWRFECDSYRRERLRANDSQFSFFVVDGMPIEAALEQLIDGYKTVLF